MRKPSHFESSFLSSWLAANPFFGVNKPRLSFDQLSQISHVQLSYQPLGTSRARVSTRINAKRHRAWPVRRVVGAMCATPHVQTWQAMGKPWIIQVDFSCPCFHGDFDRSKVLSYQLPGWVILNHTQSTHPSETGTFLRKTWDSFSKLATVIGLIVVGKLLGNLGSEALKKWCNQE